MTPFVSQIADLLGYEAAEFVVLTGALADWNPQARRAVLLREVQGVSCPRIFGHRFVQPETFMMKSSMNQIETNDVKDDPEVSRVERSSSRQSPDHAFPGQGTTRRAPLAAGQRWSVARKR